MVVGLYVVDSCCYFLLHLLPVNCLVIVNIYCWVVLVVSVITVWNQIEPEYGSNLWNEALNKRLGTQNLSLPEILVEVEKRGSSFAKLLAIPEQDDWVYSDGKSASCVTCILEMYKEGGLFGELASSIQVTEFTIKDAYTLHFFENNSSRLPKWCNANDTVKFPFCQIGGKSVWNYLKTIAWICTPI